MAVAVAVAVSGGVAVAVAVRSHLAIVPCACVRAAIRFPAGATWQQKATLINTAILIDFLFFERKNNNNSGN